MRRRLFLIFILISTVAVMGCKISGIITTSNGDGVEGVTVQLDCVDSIKGCDEAMRTRTDGDGIFIFKGLRPGIYTITPEDDEYTFDPVSLNVAIDTANVVDANFEAVASGPSLPLPQWSTYQGNAAHTGYVPVSLNPNDFFEGWTRDLIGSTAINQVAAGDGKVFVTTIGVHGPNVAVALDSDTGDELWTYHFGNIFSIQPPAYAKGIVYIQSNNHQDDSFVWAFDAESGDVIFKAVYGAQWYSYYAPTVYDGNVYVAGGYYGGAYGFNGVSGEELWYVDLNQYDQWTPAVNEAHVIAYTGENDPQLTVINRLTGMVEFSISDPNFVWNGWSMNLAPVLGSQNKVIAIHDGRLISFDLMNKIIGWETRGEADPVDKGFIGQPSVANGTIYAIYEGFLNARNESDGSFIWAWQPPEGSIDFPMIVTDNLIFASTASMTYAVNLVTQTQQWSYEAGGQLALSDDGVLFIATAEGQLHAIFTD